MLILEVWPLCCCLIYFKEDGRRRNMMSRTCVKNCVYFRCEVASQLVFTFMYKGKSIRSCELALNRRIEKVMNISIKSVSSTRHCLGLQHIQQFIHTHQVQKERCDDHPRRKSALRNSPGNLQPTVFLIHLATFFAELP